ncbi:hypothetical protein N7470_006599 [Penicillium chermesinum]|nr:hypothetical protein N7470_006599 [Penicillium chermesinum]
MKFAQRENSQASTLAGPPQPGSRSQLPMLEKPETLRNNLLCVSGEFVGTFLFLFFSFAGTQVSNTPMPKEGSYPEYLESAVFGVVLWICSDGQRVTLALCVTGGMPALRGLLVFPAQLVAGIAAAGVVSCLFPGPLNCATRLGGGASISQGLFIEMFLTAQLVLVIIMLAVVKHKSTFLAPVGIGLAFFVCELVGDYYTGGSLNPARSLGPDVINRNFPGYHWIYWVGPLLGSLLASAFFWGLRLVRWEKINPGQDFNEWESRAQKNLEAGSDHTIAAGDQVHGFYPSSRTNGNPASQRSPSADPGLAEMDNAGNAAPDSNEQANAPVGVSDEEHV